MPDELHLTPKSLNLEIPFNIVHDSKTNTFFLYSNHNECEYKYILKKNKFGFFRLKDKKIFQESNKILVERLNEFSSNWLSDRAQGFEPEINIYENKKKPGYGPENIYVENKPFSLKQICDLIESKDIELSPDFQRNFIWDKTRQSKLIESILLGLPLPSIYFSQYEDGRLTIVDGLQRIHTINNFLNNQLQLTNLEYLKECNGKNFDELKDKKILKDLQIRKFSQTQVMCFVIDYRSPSELKFDLFRRLNTGGKPLNNQEIRNCLLHPSNQRVLKSMTGLESFKNATDSSIKNTRMEDREAALRFIYFIEQFTEESPTGNYNGDMESTLDNFIDELNKRDPNEIEKYINLYDISLKNAYYLFGKNSFRKIIQTEKGKPRRTAINKLLMLTLTVLLSKYDPKIIEESLEKDSLLVPFIDFLNNENDLFEYITYGTNAKKNIHVSFHAFNKFLKKHLGKING